jgi:prepilin-type N-terminal cleavage/methylation domain-containing protein
MIKHRLLSHTARSSRGGFTLVELLVVIGIIAILAGVALGPITSGIEKAKESSGMQSARSINLLMFSYSNDNNQTYPPGGGNANPIIGTSAPPNNGTSAGVAIQLLQGGYATDPTIFALQGTTKYAGTTAGFTDFSAQNISWDFTGGATTTTGITSSASDLIPIVYCTGESVTYPAAASQGLNLSLSGKGPFKNNGIAVAYKSNSAVFIKGTKSGANAVANGFISAADTDTSTYTQVKSGNSVYQ